MTALGHAFTIWARIHLGRNWAGHLSIQHDHQLVQDGPYRFCRHPIYVGLMIAYAGTALAIGTLTAFLAPVAAFLAFRCKSRIEELQLGVIFPAYAGYRRETWF